MAQELPCHMLSPPYGNLRDHSFEPHQVILRKVLEGTGFLPRYSCNPDHCCKQDRKIGADVMMSPLEACESQMLAASYLGTFAGSLRSCWFFGAFQPSAQKKVYSAADYCDALITGRCPHQSRSRRRRRPTDQQPPCPPASPRRPKEIS